MAEAQVRLCKLSGQHEDVQTEKARGDNAEKARPCEVGAQADPSGGYS